MERQREIGREEDRERDKEREIQKQNKTDTSLERLTPIRFASMGQSLAMFLFSQADNPIAYVSI